MSQTNKKQGWHSEVERSGSFELENVDVFVLNPRDNHELVQRLTTNKMWKIACKTSDLVIFVHSTS